VESQSQRRLRQLAPQGFVPAFQSAAITGLRPPVRYGAGGCKSSENHTSPHAKRGNAMIHVKLTDDVFAPEQKRKVIAELTRVIVSVKGKQPVTLVVIEDAAPEADVVFC